MAARRLCACDAEIAREHRLARHQIVPAAGLPGAQRVITDREERALFVIEEGEIHVLGKYTKTRGKRLLPLLLRKRGGGQQRGAEIAAVHRGDKGRLQHREGACIVPVVKVSAIALHLLGRVGQPADKGRGLVRADQSKIAGGDGRRHG